MDIIKLWEKLKYGNGFIGCTTIDVEIEWCRMMPICIGGKVVDNDDIVGSRRAGKYGILIDWLNVHDQRGGNGMLSME